MPDGAALQSQWVRLDGLRMHARVSINRGMPSERLPLVLVHGLVVSSRYMLPLAELLAPEFHVYAPDLPGFGDSDKPAHTLDIRALADALAAWMVACGIERAVLVAISFGCQVLAELALRHPRRVDRLVFQGPTVDAKARTVRQQLLRIWLNGRRERVSLGRISLVDYAKAGVVRAVRTFRYALADRIEDKLPRIGVPVLVVRGERDPVVPQAWAEAVTSLLPQGRLVVIPGAFHTVNYSAPEALVRAIRPFLLELGRAQPPNTARSWPAS